jgi:hypothetical protein
MNKFNFDIKRNINERLIQRAQQAVAQQGDNINTAVATAATNIDFKKFMFPKLISRINAPSRDIFFTEQSKIYIRVGKDFKVSSYNIDMYGFYINFEYIEAPLDDEFIEAPYSAYFKFDLNVIPTRFRMNKKESWHDTVCFGPRAYIYDPINNFLNIPYSAGREKINIPGFNTKGFNINTIIATVENAEKLLEIINKILDNKKAIIKSSQHMIAYYKKANLNILFDSKRFNPGFEKLLKYIIEKSV